MPCHTCDFVARLCRASESRVKVARQNRRCDMALSPMSRGESKYLGKLIKAMQLIQNVNNSGTFIVYINTCSDVYQSVYLLNGLPQLRALPHASGKVAREGNGKWREKERRKGKGRMGET